MMFDPKNLSSLCLEMGEVKQDLSGFFHKKTPGALAAIDVERLLNRTERGVNFLRTECERGHLEALSTVYDALDLGEVGELLLKLRRESSVILVIGIGGSSLGAQAFSRLNYKPLSAPKLLFVENIDPHSIHQLCEELKSEKVGVLVVSKSGRTAETLAQYMTFHSVFPDLDERTLVITEEGSSPLKRFVEERNLPFLAHPQGIGGRFSAFSIVCLAPALLMGLDPLAIRAGGKGVLEAFFGRPVSQNAIALATVCQYALATERGVTQTVLWPYVDRLDLFGLWFRQLWAESLGKEGKGVTPIRAMGTVDQHSQLQLYLDGPRDKVFSLVYVEGEEHSLPVLESQDPELAYLKGHTMTHLMEAEVVATYRSLINQGCPTRMMTVEKITEETLGALMMTFMVETFLMGFLMGVDPTSQPAVEEGKRLAREILLK